jgi:hypothetical protein
MVFEKQTIEYYHFYDLLDLVEDDELKENIQYTLSEYSSKSDDADIVLVNGWKVYECFSGTLVDLPEYEELLQELEFLQGDDVLVSY